MNVNIKNLILFVSIFISLVILYPIVKQEVKIQQYLKCLDVKYDKVNPQPFMVCL